MAQVPQENNAKMYYFFQNIFESMDHKKLSLLKELLVHNAMRDKPSNSSAGERDTKGKNNNGMQFVMSFDKVILKDGQRK